MYEVSCSKCIARGVKCTEINASCKEIREVCKQSTLKFAEWLNDKNYLCYIEYDEDEDFEGNIVMDMREAYLDVDEVLDEYEKENIK